MTPELTLYLTVGLLLVVIVVGFWAEWRRHQRAKRAPFVRLARIYRGGAK